MPEPLILLDGETSAFLKVEKADGRVLYYRVENDESTEITFEEYAQEVGE